MDKFKKFLTGIKTVDLGFQFTDDNGKPMDYRKIWEEDDGTQKSEMKPFTLKRGIKNALLERTDKEGEYTIEDTKARYDLWKKIEDKDIVDLNKSERDLIKQCALRRYEIRLSGQIINLI